MPAQNIPWHVKINSSPLTSAWPHTCDTDPSSEHVYNNTAEAADAINKTDHFKASCHYFSILSQFEESKSIKHHQKAHNRQMFSKLVIW